MRIQIIAPGDAIKMSITALNFFKFTETSNRAGISNKIDWKNIQVLRNSNALKKGLDQVTLEVN